MSFFMLGGFCRGKRNGNYANPRNCHGYIACSNGYTHYMPCPAGLKWNDNKKRCDWPRNVHCSGHPGKYWFIFEYLLILINTYNISFRKYPLGVMHLITVFFITLFQVVAVIDFLVRAAGFSNVILSAEEPWSVTFFVENPAGGVIEVFKGLFA